MRAFLGQTTEWFRRRGLAPAVALAYAGMVGLFLWTVAQFYIPGKGFSYLIAFGAKQEDMRISKVRRLERHVQRASDGYDAQFYVQIAMDPSLRNRELHHALDSLPYRARRILFAATAYALGLGRPEWILQTFALQNVVSWLLLAVLLLHWFPPRDWDCFLRWAGVLYSFGLCVSLRNALFDGPSLLLIALGVFFHDKGRPWLATAVFAVGGLGKETNLLGSSALLPGRREGWRAWGGAATRGLLTVLPLGLWLVYIAVNVGSAADLGARNFDLPFVSYGRKWAAVVAGLPDLLSAGPGVLWSLLMLVVLTVQFLFLACRPRWSDAWWRVGMSYAVLMLVLGDAVWECYPGAASRVLLPMQLAFNVLVPASGRFWRTVLMLGNLTMLAAPAALERPDANLGYILNAETATYANARGDTLRVDFSPEWHHPEQSAAGFRLWAPGNASIGFHNPHSRPLLIRVRFEINAEGAREVKLLRGESELLWRVYLPEGAKSSASLPNLRLPPGDSRIDFVTDQPARVHPPDPRSLAYCVHNLRFDIERFADEGDLSR